MVLHAEGLSPEALREAAAYRARGRLGDIEPELELAAPRRAPTGRDCEIRWRTRRTTRTHLRVVAGNVVVLDRIVPAESRASFRPAAAGPHRITLKARGRTGWREVRAEIAVFAPQPTIRLDGPRGITFGDTARITWIVNDADAVRLTVDGATQAVGQAGETVLRPLSCDAQVVLLQAEGPGGRATKQLSLAVMAPPVVWRAPTLVRAVMGDEARIAYEVSGARGLALDGPWGERLQGLPFKGTIITEEGFEACRIRLIAIGHDDRRYEHAITLLPTVPAVDIGPELMVLAARDG